VITAVVKALSYTDGGGTTHTLTGVTEGDTVEIGRITLSTFVNAAGLEKVGSSLYTVSANSGEPVVDYVNEDCGKMESGFLEMSNVELSTELTNMIIMQRGFQANSRVITTSDTMLEELVNLKR
jgi:flagellar hook protein FlgE